MLIIGHRGAAGLAPENSLAALKAGAEAGADMLEFDIRLTRDNVPIMIHDAHLLRTHHSLKIIPRLTYQQLSKIIAPAPLVTLDTVLDLYFGKTLLNIEVKSRGAGRIVAETVAERAKQSGKKWDYVVFSSFKARNLLAIRRVAPKANLALLHHNNPFSFVAYHKFLGLTAVGFHRLHLNKLALEIAKRAGIFSYVYTVNRPKAALLLSEQGYDGIVTNYPDRIEHAFRQAHASDDD